MKSLLIRPKYAGGEKRLRSPIAIDKTTKIPVNAIRISNLAGDRRPLTVARLASKKSCIAIRKKEKQLVLQRQWRS
jgi:hypothetical protein